MTEEGCLVAEGSRTGFDHTWRVSEGSSRYMKVRTQGQTLEHRREAREYFVSSCKRCRTLVILFKKGYKYEWIRAGHTAHTEQTSAGQ